MLLVSPITWPHYLVMLVVPVALLIANVPRGRLGGSSWFVRHPVAPDTFGLDGLRGGRGRADSVHDGPFAGGTCSSHRSTLALLGSSFGVRLPGASSIPEPENRAAPIDGDTGRGPCRWACHSCGFKKFSHSRWPSVFDGRALREGLRHSFVKASWLRHRILVELCGLCA